MIVFLPEIDLVATCEACEESGTWRHLHAPKNSIYIHVKLSVDHNQWAAGRLVEKHRLRR